MFLNLENIPPAFKGYVKLVEEPDVMQALRISGYRTQELVHSIKENLGDHRYAAGKWSIKEVLCHMIDAERIFAYRALRFARNDRTNLHSFDENTYAPEANAQNRTLRRIADEMQHVRTSTLDLFESFSEEMLSRKGLANGNEVSVIALGFIIAGHDTHHYRVLKERYLNA